MALEDLPPGVLQVLLQAWRSPFTTKSDFARSEAPLVALCACAGLLTTTTHDPQEPWGPYWRVTAKGLLLIEGMPQCSNLSSIG